MGTLGDLNSSGFVGFESFPSIESAIVARQLFVI
jgi:hypothetical protein